MKSYQHSSEKEILSHAKTLEGLTFSEIEKLSACKHKRNKNNKGDQGNFIEKFGFGIENNNFAEPDFIGAKIELKICPLKISRNQLTVKERTKICSINYEKLAKETWLESSARKKLSKILFVFYRWDKDSWSSQKVEKITLWRIQPDESLISQEWRSTKEIVKQGRAHLLSEAWYKALSPSTSGSGGRADNVKQPFQHISRYAKKRAFSLKRPFVNQYWESLTRPESFESIQETLELKAEDNIEKKLIELFGPFIGKPIQEIAKELNIEVRSSKNATNLIIKRILKFRNFSSRIKEFEQSGIIIKTVPVNKNNNYKPYESTSFPVVSFKELIQDQDYYCSALSEQLARIFFIPIHREKRDTPLSEAILLKPFFWSPDQKEEKIIRDEWKMTINIIKKGIRVEKVSWGESFRESNNLPKSSETKILHMRPHAKDSTDRDEDAYGTSITKQSFWLNRNFIQKIVSQSS